MADFGFFDPKSDAQQGFRTLCQEPSCHALLGSIHFSCAGGRVLQVCHMCGTVSEFRNTAYGIKTGAVGKVQVKANGAGARPRSAAVGAPPVVRPKVRVPGERE